MKKFILFLLLMLLVLVRAGAVGAVEPDPSGAKTGTAADVFGALTGKEFAAMRVFFKLLNAVVPMRVPKEMEIEGLNMHEAAILAYPDFSVRRADVS